MNIDSQKICKSAELLGAICGSLLISTVIIPRTAFAQQPNSKINPCPSIFYEEPHNNRVLTPPGCPPNTLTQRLAAQGLLPPVSSSPATQSPYQNGLSVGGEAPQSAVPGLNPCPRIYYEEPFNSRNIVPQGCPPNALTQQQQPQTVAPPPVSTTQPPLPEQRQAPSTTIALANGRVNVRLVNDTAANVTYQVVGNTEPRSLQGKSDVVLRGLSAPTTVTFQRDDGGLLLVTPQPSSQPGILEVTFKETTNVSQDRNAMRIQENGSVFLN